MEKDDEENRDPSETIKMFDTARRVPVHSFLSPARIRKFRVTSCAVNQRSVVLVPSGNCFWMEWFGNFARINADASQQLMHCRTVQQVAELQNDFASSTMRSWMEGNAKVLEIAQRTSKQAVGPLNGRLRDAA